MGKRRPRVQECRRRFDGKCFFCGEAEGTVLNAHRLVPGEDGGVYRWENLLTVCANCHARIHAGQIVIKGRFLSTAGPVVIYREGDREVVRREWEGR